MLFYMVTVCPLGKLANQPNETSDIQCSGTDDQAPFADAMVGVFLNLSALFWSTICDNT